MELKRITKRWFTKYFGFDPDPEKEFFSLWETDGGRGTLDCIAFIKGYELIHRSSSKSYWGKIRREKERENAKQT